MTLSRPIQYQIMVDTIDSQYAVEIKKLIFPGYNNNEYIDGKLYMFFMVINKFTSTETRVLYGTYGNYRPVYYPTYIFSVMGQAFHMLHMVLICSGDMMNNNQ